MSQNPHTDPERTPEVEQGPISPERLAEAARKAEIERLTGIGGWLITYFVYQGLNILSFLSSFAGGDEGMEALRLQDPLTAASVDRMESLASIMGGASVLGIFFCVLLVVQRKKIAIMSNVVLLAVQSVFAVAAIIMLTSVLSAYLDNTESNIFIGGVILQVALNLAWIAYFLKAKRVQLTFTS